MVCGERWGARGQTLVQGRKTDPGTRTSRLRSPIMAITVTSAELWRDMEPSRVPEPGTDGTASEFPAKGAGNPWQSRQSPEGQFFMKFRGPKADPGLPLLTCGGSEKQTCRGCGGEAPSHRPCGC